MKRHLSSLATLLLLASLARGAVPFDWTADVDRPAAVPIPILRGETVDLSCSLVRQGRPFDPAAESATLYWQTNGMGSAWWTAPATVASNRLSATFTPAMDPGAPVASAFIGTAGGDGRAYRALAMLRFLHAPGAAPNELPLPVKILDFATIAITNAPWPDASAFIPSDGGTFGGSYRYTGGQISFGVNSGLTDSEGELLVAPADRVLLGDWLLVGGELEAQSLRTPALYLWDIDEQRYRQIILSSGHLYIQ